MIAGIGFTVALFVSSLSFPAGGELEPVAKIGILDRLARGRGAGNGVPRSRAGPGSRGALTLGAALSTLQLSGALLPRTKGAG